MVVLLFSRRIQGIERKAGVQPAEQSRQYTFFIVAETWSGRRDCLWPGSHHLALPQLGDLVLAEAELGKQLFGLLAEFRRARRHPAWGA